MLLTTFSEFDIEIYKGRLFIMKLKKIKNQSFNHEFLVVV